MEKIKQFKTRVIKMKFSLSEVLSCGSHKFKESEIDLVTKRNLLDLIDKVNALGYTPPMRATSCLRSLEDQKRINPSAMGSSHLYGCAIDIADPKGELKAWLLKNQSRLIECGLWMESPDHTKTWCHLTTIRPKSGNRFFIP
ncbi:MAG: hypothetical protein MJZ20_02785 [Bacteroidaceae bacterium]|nr:hypothetical protein [Bacteroidaceae bacterium]